MKQNYSDRWIDSSVIIDFPVSGHLADLFREMEEKAIVDSAECDAIAETIDVVAKNNVGITITEKQWETICQKYCWKAWGWMK